MADTTFVDGSTVILAGWLNDINRLYYTLFGGTTYASNVFTVDNTTGAVSTAKDVTITGAFTSPGIDDNALATAITIDSTGNTGIGTSAPITDLHVQHQNTSITYTPYTGTIATFEGGTTTTGNVSIITGATHTAELWFGTPSNEAVSRVRTDNNLSNLELWTGGLSRLSIDSSGKIGIGKTPSSLLHVSQNVNNSADWYSDTGVVANIEQTNASGHSSLKLSNQAGQGSYLIFNGSSGGYFSIFDRTTVADRLFIDTSGKVGIGTSSPGVRFQVIESSAVGHVASFKSTGVAYSYISVYDSAAAIQSVLYADASAGSTGTLTNYPFTVRVNNTEVARFDTSGDFLIGKTATSITTAGHSFFPNGTVYHTSDGGASLYVDRLTSDGVCVYFYRDATAVGNISVTTTATAYNTSSDYRLKENVIEITDGIDRIKQLKPSRFNFIAEPTKTVDGFLAHEAQSIVPESVTGTKDAVDENGNPEYQAIDQSKLVPLLTAALKESIAKNEALVALMVAKGLITQAEADAL